MEYDPQMQAYEAELAQETREMQAEALERTELDDDAETGEADWM